MRAERGEHKFVHGQPAHPALMFDGVLAVAEIPAIHAEAVSKLGQHWQRRRQLRMQNNIVFQIQKPATVRQMLVGIRERGAGVQVVVRVGVAQALRRLERPQRKAETQRGEVHEKPPILR